MVRSPDDNVDLLTIKNSTAAALVAADRRDKAIDQTAAPEGALLRPKSPTFMLACKHIGCAPEDLLEREPGPEVHSLPDDIVRLRLQHEERRRRQLVALTLTLSLSLSLSLSLTLSLTLSLSLSLTLTRCSQRSAPSSTRTGTCEARSPSRRAARRAWRSSQSPTVRVRGSTGKPLP